MEPERTFVALLLTLIPLAFAQVVYQQQSPQNQLDNQQRQHQKEAFCHLDNFHLCRNSMESVAQRSDLVTTKAELIAFCIKLKESVKCMDHHIRLCFGPTERKVYNHVIAGARQMTEELCVPGKFQEDYLRHAACVTNATNPCESLYNEVVAFSQSVKDIEDVKEGLKGTCCRFNEFVRCKNLQVTEECGPEASIFHKRHLDKITNHLIHEHCATFIHLPESCLPPDAGVTPTPSCPLALLLLTSMAPLLRIEP